MNESSLLMIHNAWTYAAGNAEELRKQADDLEKITQASVIAYKAHSNLSEKEIKKLMDNETWILPEEAVSYGFATSIIETEKSEVSQSARARLFDIVKMHQEEAENTEEETEEDTTDEDNTEDVDNTEDNTEETEDEDAEDNTDDNAPETDNAEDEEEKPTEKLNKFFNAIMKM